MSTNSINMTAEEITEKVTAILGNIIQTNSKYFREEETLQVSPGYGYDKFYLDWVDGSYDMSLQGLIHYIMYEEEIYKKILNKEQYAILEKVVEEDPEAIYGPDYEENNYEELQYEVLEPVYWDSIAFVGKKLLEQGFDVEETFSEYLEEDE